MSGSFYLNPVTIKFQCGAAKNKLGKAILQTKRIEESLNEFINNEEIQSEAFDALKQQISDYKSILKSLRSLSRYYIRQYQIFIDSVGYEVLEGDKILAAQEMCRRKIMEYEEKAESCRRNANTYAEIGPYAEYCRFSAGRYEELADNSRRMLAAWKAKEEKYYEIDSMTRNLFKTGDSTAAQIRAALSELGKSFSEGAFHPNLTSAWRTKLKEEARELEVITIYGIKRPEDIDEKTWEAYQEKVTEHIEFLDKQGWHVDIIKAYGKYINCRVGEKCSASEVITKLKKCNKDTQVIGSPVFLDMWYAWRIDEYSKFIDIKDGGKSREKLETLMKVSGMKKIDENSSAEEFRKVMSQISPKLSPDDKFWRSLSETVEGTFCPEGMRGELGKQVHLLRYVISYQQTEYIRNNYKGKTDEDKLVEYLKKNKVDWTERDNLMGDLRRNRVGWTEKESVRLHLKSYNNGEIFPEGHSTANGGVNLKVLTNGKFHSEFIINGDGKFLNLLDENATQDAKVNCSSFNYGSANDDVHKVLDVEPVSRFEPAFRDASLFVKGKEEIKAEFEAPEKKDMRKYDVLIEKRRENFRRKVESCGD